MLIHWQLKLAEKKSSGGGSEVTAPSEDAKFPILLGDQYHSMAYFMITRIGNVELTKQLTHIEEGFWKIFYNVEKFGSDIQQNLKFIYEHFYNYLPQFMGNTFKGLGLIYNLGQDGIVDMRTAGVQLGYFYQFAIFSYIMTAILH